MMSVDVECMYDESSVSVMGGDVECEWDLCV